MSEELFIILKRASTFLFVILLVYGWPFDKAGLWRTIKKAIDKED